MDRALLVGINAYPSAPLSGCINDVTDMATHLVNHCGFSEGSIRLLCDGRATTTELRARLNWLVAAARPGDRLFFHYSGHGVQVATRTPWGEVDGLDEAICPVDFDWSDERMIRDKEFNQIFANVPPGCEFVWISDSCHSADSTKGMPPQATKYRTYPPPPDITWRLNVALSKKFKTPGLQDGANPVHVALISGCQSDQSSADSSFEGKPNGALTYFLLQTLRQSGNAALSLDKLLEKVKAAIKKHKKFDQIPGVEGNPEIIARPFLAIPNGRT